MRYLMAKQAARERTADELMWISTGLVIGVVLMTLWIMVAAI